MPWDRPAAWIPTVRNMSRVLTPLNIMWRAIEATMPPGPLVEQAQAQREEEDRDRRRPDRPVQGGEDSDTATLARRAGRLAPVGSSVTGSTSWLMGKSGAIGVLARRGRVSGKMFDLDVGLGHDEIGFESARRGASIGSASSVSRSIGAMAPCPEGEPGQPAEQDAAEDQLLGGRGEDDPGQDQDRHHRRARFVLADGILERVDVVFPR